MASKAPTCPEEYHSIPTEELEKIRTALADGDFNEVVSKVKKSLETPEIVKLHIAVTGDTGVGKSTFVNAIRGLGDDDEQSAETGPVQTTLVPKQYLHPQHKNVAFWDLPGIGTEQFKPEVYLKQVNFSRYDFFILISDRFTCNDALLAREIKKMEKKFYFVRSKIDNDLRAEKRRKARDENEILLQIRVDCISRLEKEGVKSVPVFLVSSFELDKYDFQSLTYTLLENLDNMKREAFLLSLPNISQSILEKKKAALKKGVWWTAAASCATGVIRIPGLTFALDVVFLTRVIEEYCRHFGLDAESLKRLSLRSGKPLDVFTRVIQSRVVGDITKVASLLDESIDAKSTFFERVFSFIPIAGAYTAGSIAFDSTYYLLNNLLDSLMEDAQRVLTKALSEA